jgi:hypothetical protein
MIYSKQTHTAEYDADQSGALIVTPSKGRKLKVTGVSISTEGASDGERKIRLSIGKRLICSYFPSTVPDSYEIRDLSIKGKTDEPILLVSTLGGGQRYFLAINYSER